MKERRTEGREKLSAFIPVYYLHPRTLLGYLADLTLHGVMVTGERPVEINKRGLLEIVFPNNLPDIDPKRMTIPSRAAWCRPDQSPHYYNIGFEFTEVTPEHTRLLNAILIRYHFPRDLTPSTFGPEDWQMDHEG